MLLERIPAWHKADRGLTPQEPGSVQTNLIQGVVAPLPVVGHFPAGGGRSEGFFHTLLDVTPLHVPRTYRGVAAVVLGWGLGAVDPAMAAVPTPETAPPEGDGGFVVRSSTGKRRKGGGRCCGEGTCNPRRRSSPPVVERVWGGGYWRRSSSQVWDWGSRRGGRGVGERVRGRDAVGGARKVGTAFLGSVIQLDVEEGRRRTVFLFLNGPCPGGGVMTLEGMGQASGASSRPSGLDSHGG